MSKYLLVTIILLFTACSNTPKPMPIQKTCILKNEKVPLWLCDKKEKTKYYTVIGYSKKQNLGDSFTLTNSINNSLNKIKEEIYQKNIDKIKEILKKNKLNVNISKQIISNVLKYNLENYKLLNYWEDSKQGIYTKISLSKKTIKDSIKREFKNYIFNNKSELKEKNFSF